MAKSAAPSVPAHLEVMRGWLGTKEIPGKRSNPVIAGTPSSWASLIGRSDVTSDEVANCAMACYASIVAAEFLKAGYKLEDLIEGGPTALEILAKQGIFVPLPPKDQRLLARSFVTYGVDASKNPAPGDFLVIPRSKPWEGHVMQLNRYLGDGVWECIGANQSDTTSYAKHRLSEAVKGGIRRYVPPTIKDLRAAGSTEVAHADMQQAAGTALVVGGVGTAVGQAVAQQAAQPVVDAAINLAPLAEQTTQVHTLTSTGIAIGSLFLQNPWLVLIIGVGVGIWWLGRTGKLKRIAKHIAGVPLSSQTA
jgi:hypothetical protein